MEICTYSTNLKPFTPLFTNKTNLKSKFFLHLNPDSISSKNPGIRYYKFSSLKVRASEESGNGVNQYVKEESDVISYSSVEATSPEEESSNGANEYVKEEYDGVVTDNEAQSEDKSGFGGFSLFNDVDAVDDQLPQFDFLNKLKVELDLEDSFSIALLGVGGFTALWLTASIVAAIDHIPLFPKLMEVVGLGYTVWFCTRYLLFKRNRDELASKIEEIKQQVLGPKK